MFRTLLCVSSIVLACPAWAWQDPAAIKAVVEEFLQAQTKGMAGAVSYTVRPFDPANMLASCDSLEAFLPAGGRPWGRTMVGVRCQAPVNWSVFVPVRIKVMGEYLVAARSLASGQLLSAHDLGIQAGDLADMPAGTVADPQQAVGRTITVGLSAGRPLRSDLLRQPLAVQPGQGVKVVSRGEGFQVTTEGRAVNGAAPGQVTLVRTANGRTVSGIAKEPGTVEIAF